MLGRVGRDRAVEGLAAQIAPRADGVRVDVDFEGELGHLGFFESFLFLFFLSCSATSERLLSAVLADLSPSGNGRGLDDLFDSGTKVNGSTGKRGTKDTAR